MVKQKRSTSLLYSSFSGNNNNSINLSAAAASNIDKIDLQIIELLVQGSSNGQIASKLKIPLSTIQRKTRKIMTSGLILSTISLNYEKFGYKIAQLHIYLQDGNIKETAKKVNEFDGVTSTEIHIGNSDVIANYVYKDSSELLDIIIQIKKLEGIDRVVWSERVSQIHSKDNSKLIKV
jgi:DNA-binding Lrp family transcriptional regulator